MSLCVCVCVCKYMHVCESVLERRAALRDAFFCVTCFVL